MLFVVAADDEVDERSRMLWRECESVGVPRAVAVTKLEHARADFDDAVARCRREFGDVQPLALPLMPVVGGAASGLLSLAVIAVGGMVAEARRRKRAG